MWTKCINSSQTFAGFLAEDAPPVEMSACKRRNEMPVPVPTGTGQPERQGKMSRPGRPDQVHRHGQQA